MSIDSRAALGQNRARLSPNAWIIAAALFAAALKIYCAATTYGSCDVTIHARFGQVVDSMGLDEMYRLDRHFNHPPFTGQLFGLIYHLSAWFTPPPPHTVPRSFPFLLRLPCIIADFLAVLLLLRFRTKLRTPPAWAIVLFALSPVNFMVSGFHGNVDPLMVCLVLVATYFCIEEHSILSAIFLALACAIKIIPLLLVPVFCFWWFGRGRQPGLRFALTFGPSCLAVWSPALIGSASYFLNNVLGYYSFPGGWGITYWFTTIRDALGYDVSPPALNRFSPLLVLLKMIVIVASVTLAWFRRGQSGKGFLVTLALVWTAFGIFAPGFVPYYLVWLAPFILFYSANWYVVFTIATSIYLFAYYNTMSHGIIPWNASDPTVGPAWNNWGILPWFVLVGIGGSAAVGALDRRLSLQTMQAKPV